MASICDSSSTTISTVREQMDDREFTVSGKDFQMPKSPAKRANHHGNSMAKSEKKSSKTSRLRPFSMPVIAPISPEDLDLESTLVAGESFVSSNSNSGERQDINCSETLSLGNTTSYSRAVHRGRLESVAISKSHMRGRKQSVLHSLMGRLRSSSVVSVADELDTKSLTSAKILRKELLRTELESDLDMGDILFMIMEKKYRKETKRPKLLVTLLTYSNINVNQRAPNGMTALHTAIQDYDLESAKVLVAFGANINATNQDRKTPLDLLNSEMESAAHFSTLDVEERSISPEQSPIKHKRHSARQTKRLARLNCIEFLKSMGALVGEFAYHPVPPSVQPFPQVPTASPCLSHHKKSRLEILDWEAQITSHHSELERNIRSRLQNSTEAGKKAVFSPDIAISLAVQLQEMSMFQKAGSRILCLDGGGIRGLIQLEILSQLELKTGRKITELFDWIVGTSTGGIIALGLVYAKKTLTQLRQLYFRMKDEVFGKVKGGVSFNTAGLEKILKEEFSETRCMDDESYPRVLISAVKKEHINLKLHFFNNCFNDDHSKHWPVWKVARYTCAAPVLFGEADDYVDGGVLANNPSESGLTKIQSFYRSRGEKLPVSLVVSVGCGKYPIQTLGNVDFLFVGSQGWSSLAGTSNLMSLLSYALVEPSVADDNCRSRCEEQGIRYFRLNPRMEEVVESGETDMETLITMILQTRKEMTGRREFGDLVLTFHELSEASRKMHVSLNGEESSDSSVSV